MGDSCARWPPNATGRYLAPLTRAEARHGPGERSLDMEGVSGSIPLPPTIHIKMLARWALGLAHEMPMNHLK